MFSYFLVVVLIWKISPVRGCLIENSGEIMKEAICHISCCMVAASLDVPSQRGDRLPFFHALPALLMLQTNNRTVLHCQEAEQPLAAAWNDAQAWAFASCLCAGTCSSSTIPAGNGSVGELLKPRWLWLWYSLRIFCFLPKTVDCPNNRV